MKEPEAHDLAVAAAPDLFDRAVLGMKNAVGRFDIASRLVLEQRTLLRDLMAAVTELFSAWSELEDPRRVLPHCDDVLLAAAMFREKLFHAEGSSEIGELKAALTIGCRFCSRAATITFDHTEYVLDCCAECVAPAMVFLAGLKRSWRNGVSILPPSLERIEQHPLLGLPPAPECPRELLRRAADAANAWLSLRCPDWRRETIDLSVADRQELEAHVAQALAQAEGTRGKGQGL